jgi:ribonuclease P protein component
VRLNGKSFPHPLIVLVAAPNHLAITRVGVVASRAVGMAVKRNRAKRLIRAALQELLPVVEPGWDMIIIARRPMNGSSYQKTFEAIRLLLARAQILKVDHASTSVA